MSHNLECLCYEGTDSSGRKSTVYYAYIAGQSVEEIEQKANALRLEGKVNVRALSWADYEAIDFEESKIKYNMNKPFAIDAEEFSDKLNVLPPCRWSNDGHREIFFVSEAITGNLYSFYVRLGLGAEARYFSINALSTATNDELFKLCESA